MRFSDKQKELLGALVGLARSLDETKYEASYAFVIAQSLCEIDNENALEENSNKVREAKRRAVPDCFVCQNPCGRTFDLDLNELEKLDEKIAEKKYELIDELIDFSRHISSDENSLKAALPKLCEGLFAVGYEWFSGEDIDKIIIKLRSFDL